MSLTIGDALRMAAGRLAPSPTALVEAEELVGRLLDLERSGLYLDRARAISQSDAERLEHWLVRRAAGEPLQYITGRAAFRGLDLAVDPSVLVPRPETEGLVESVLEVLRAEAGAWPAPRVLDLGTGSGAIALALAAEFPSARVTAVDSSEAALATARRNAAALGLEHRIRFFRGHWFEPVDPGERFEAIISNPPYVAEFERDELPPEVVGHEPHEALFSSADGLEATREIVEEAPRHLVGGGLLAIELAEHRAAEVAGWFEGARDWSAARLREDLAGRPRVLLARRERGPAIAPAQWGEDPEPDF